MIAIEKCINNVNIFDVLICTRSYVANRFNNNYHICSHITDEKITKFLDENLVSCDQEIIISDYGNGCSLIFEATTGSNIDYYKHACGGNSNYVMLSIDYKYTSTTSKS